MIGAGVGGVAGGVVGGAFGLFAAVVGSKGLGPTVIESREILCHCDKFEERNDFIHATVKL